MGTDCKSVGDAFVGSNPTLPTIKQALFPKEQPKNQIRPRSSAAEHFFGKEEVTGSILVEGSSFLNLNPKVSATLVRAKDLRSLNWSLNCVP